MEKLGLAPYIIPGIDGTRAMPGDFTWRRAAVTWGLIGMPFIEKCVEFNNDFLAENEKKWYVICEDSAVPLVGKNMASILRALTTADRGAEIIQAGYRFQVQKGFRSHELNLHTMELVPGTGMHISRACGQKMLLATYKGINLIKDRLLKGPPAYYDHCISELQRSKMVHLMHRPICGSRGHFSLVSAKKEKWVKAELAVGAYPSQAPKGAS